MAVRSLMGVVMVSLVKSMAILMALSGPCVLKVQAQDAPSTSQTLPDKRAKIRIIFEATDTRALSRRMLETKLPQTLAGIRAKNPDMTIGQIQEFTTVYRKHFESHLKDLNEIVFDTWNKFYNDEEIDAYYKFVMSPAGKSFLSKMPVETNAALDTIQTYSKTILGPELEKRIKEDSQLAGLKLY